jgi:hypothetical protein
LALKLNENLPITEAESSDLLEIVWLVLKGEFMGIQAIGGPSTADRAILAQSQSTSASKPTDQAVQPFAVKVGGVHPARGGGAKPAAASGSSSTPKTYDPKDINKDGVVSEQEAYAYTVTHPTATAQSQAASPSSRLQTGLNAYQLAQQPDSTSMSSLILDV